MATLLGITVPINKNYKCNISYAKTPLCKETDEKTSLYYPYFQQCTNQKEPIYYTTPNIEGYHNGICQKYNNGIKAILASYSNIDKNSWIILAHDDTDLISHNLLKILDEMYERGADIVGVAGSVKVPPLNPGYWWYGINTPLFQGSGMIELPRSGKLETIAYGPYPQKVATLDGCWLALRETTFNKLWFDSQTFNGYHYYDADFCATARSQGFQIWTSGVHLRHNSDGNVENNKDFLLYQKKFIEKWSQQSELYYQNSTDLS